MKFVRAQILLKPEQHKYLADQAKREGCSISEIVREIISGYFQNQEDATKAKHLKALDKAGQLRRQIRKRRFGKPLDIDISKIIQQTHEERDDQTLGSN